MLRTPFAEGADALKGTQHLLTAAGRRTLADHYREAFRGGANAVCTALNTSQEYLDEHGFWDDMSRDNDISYYVVGAGNGVARS